MGMKSRKHIVLKAVLIVLGLLIGWWHFRLSLQTIFLMRDEKLLLTAVLLGPFSTLPVVVIGVFRPKLAGVWLVLSGAAFMCLSAIAGPMDTQQMKTGLLLFLLPMCLLGTGFMGLARAQKA
jgi:hypothetical protein